MSGPFRFTGIFLTAMLLCMRLPAQHIKGLPFIKNYSPRDYKATPQNLGISQSAEGLFYFANAAGVLEFNGKNWKLHKIPGNVATNCVLASRDRNIYAGAFGEFGYFKKMETGELKYRSLTPKNNADIGKIVSIHELKDGIYFQTKKGFYQAKNDKVHFIEAPANLHIAHFCNGHIFVKLKERGLYEFTGHAYKPVPYGEMFASAPIFGVIEGPNTFAVITDTEVYVAIKDKPFEKMDLPFSNFNSVKLLDNKYISFGLFGDGLVVTDYTGKIVHQLTVDNGLQDGTINDQFLDSEKNLWLALNRGITKVEVFSPVTSFGFNQGIKSSIESILDFKNEIYISTYNGLFYLNKTSRKFEQVSGLKSDCYGLNTFVFNGDTSLYVAANSGISRISNHSAQKVIDCIPYNFAQSAYYQNRIFVCNDDGFRSYIYVNGVWKQEDLDYEISSPVFTFCEENDRTVWVSDLNEGVYRVSIQPSMKEKVTVDRLDKNSLPKGFVYVYNYKKQVLFGTSNGIYEYSEKDKKFTRSAFNPPFKEKFAVHRMAVDGKNNLWLSVFYERNAEYDVTYYNGTSWIYQSFQQSGNDIIQCIGSDKNFAYFGSASGLFCYDYSEHINYETGFKTYIDEFAAEGERQSITENGSSRALAYRQNDLIFQFYANSYTEEQGTVYSYFLEGYSKKYSKWTTDNHAIFTNLHEGDYVFKVKAKNIFGKVSPEAKFSFTILAPWYRTWWAYCLYVVLLIAFVYLVVSYSTRKLKNVIKERTAEVVQQKEEIEKQKVVLEVKNRDILDSIKYAKRIQETIIPSEETLQKAITSDMFAFFKPKDIVSGDFYWMSEVDDLVLIAVVDCTGHGVPGALVSIVGNNGLNRAVNEFKLRKPAEILDKLAILTEEAFRQSGKEELRDGMDITLLSIHKKTGEMQYAGANNPLWIVRSNNTFEEIKANKQPIGKFENRQPFTNHSFRLNKGDSVFMFTDGYADQFGGPGGKKFKYKQLQELLILNSQLKFPFLKSLLSQTFEEW
ncbi:MAG TPA: SpoIIE family protein phosphatase, partial [Flavobacteriales bacterium]|nr:SpoIIE family protein phosphatase [Flavobacteriales bacterium]